VRQQVKLHTNKGRVDAVIESKNNIFIAEFKMGSAEEGMRQIHSKKYYEQFVSSGKKIFLLAIGFDEKERNIGSYLVEEVEELTSCKSPRPSIDGSSYLIS